MPSFFTQSLTELLESFESPCQARASYLIKDLAKLDDAGDSVKNFLDMGTGSGSMSFAAQKELTAGSSVSPYIF